MNPGMKIRSYLKGKPHLNLANLRKIYRSHYQEREVTEMYQLLSSGVQEGGEIPKDFLVRLLDLTVLRALPLPHWKVFENFLTSF